MKHQFFIIVIMVILVGTMNMDAKEGTSKKAKTANSECGIEPKSEEFVKVDSAPTVDLQQLQKNVVYPETARKSGIEGTVMVRALISKSGKVIKTIISSSDSKLFNKSAQKAVKISKFTPAIDKGQAVCCWVTLPIKFKLK